MDAVTISPEFQIVMPQAVCEALKLKPGEKMRVLQFDNRIELIRVSAQKKARGMLEGMDTVIVRNANRV
ncbi:MAG: AbrB/MazE/SpoVT family DNA-binding domain-containing protein [Burkholderiales bacterium]|nr:AbrB/MazE/SpoVT family DNA-binding domain-containing protein [Burkholderiales bacterium]